MTLLPARSKGNEMYVDDATFLPELTLVPLGRPRMCPGDSQRESYKSIKCIFERLDNWRKLPNYQMERRVDIFFGLYLVDIVQGYLAKKQGGKIIHEPIPEFPLKKSLVDARDATNRSVKVDYALFPQELDEVILLELKTDHGSICKEQLGKFCKVAADETWKDVVEGLKSIFAAGDRKKYHHLFKMLEVAGSVDSVPALDEVLKHNKTARDLISGIKAVNGDRKIRIVYIVPTREKLEKIRRFSYLSEIDVITFNEVAEYLEAITSQDAVAKLFVEYLGCWGQAP